MTVRHDAFLALDQTIMRLEDRLVTGLGEVFSADPQGEFYAYHPLPMPEFLRGMAACGEPGSFLDLGCGIGTKMLVAYLLGWQVSGVEWNPAYATLARLLVPEAEVEVGDVRDADPRGFDVVYSYRLVVDLDAQQELNASIAGRMTRGSLFFCAGSDPVGLEPVGSGVWRV